MIEERHLHWRGPLKLGSIDIERTSIVDANTYLHDLEYVCFDIETTGLSPVVARLVEISGVKFRLHEKEITSSFSSLINPETEIPAEATAVHGITNKMVANEPKFEQVVAEFIQWIGHDKVVLVAHNAPFDLGFLRVALMKMGQNLPCNPVIDTLTLSRTVAVDAPNHQLKTLVEHFALDPGSYHRALADSYHVLNLLRSLIKISAVSSWGDLAKLGCLLSFDRLEDFADKISHSPQTLRSVESLNQAITRGLSVNLTYQGYKSTSRTVRPLNLIVSRGNYYLTAYCESAEAERTFRVDRIASLELLTSEIV
jgi:DNA polymerase III epsilon subunit family exonuclease